MDSEHKQIDDDIVKKKQQELREAINLRISSLSATIEQRDEKISDLKKKLGTLKDDFYYNLQLIRDRDKDIEHFQSSMQALYNNLTAKEGELNRAKVKLESIEQRSRDMKLELLTTRNSLHQKIAELDSQLADMQRQTEFKTKCSEEERSLEHQRHTQKLMELEHGFQLQRDKLEQEHASAISSIQTEHDKALINLKHALELANGNIF